MVSFCVQFLFINYKIFFDIISVGADMWIGLSKYRFNGTYDVSIREDEDVLQMTEDESPLEMIETDEWTYSNGVPFDPANVGSNYDMGIDRFEPYDCAYLKASSSFDSKVAVCTKVYAYVCSWNSKIYNLNLNKMFNNLII